MKSPADQPASSHPCCAAAKWTIPNMLSGLRILSVPFLILIAWRGESRLYIICLAFSLATDFLDGFLARLLNQRTELGAKLDLWGDAGVLLSLPLALWWMWPDVLRSERWFIGAALASYAVSATVALWKFRQLASYHSWLGKTGTMVLSIGALAVMLGWAQWPLRVGLLLMTAAIFEEVAISLLLTEPRSNIPSWWHARKLTISTRPIDKESPGRVQA